MYETLDIEHKDGVATLWMNRPELHNAFNETVIAELTRALRASTRTMRMCVWWCWLAEGKASRLGRISTG